LLARLGFEVRSVRGIAQAALVLSGSQTVALVLVSADPPATEASDLLPLLSEFRAARAARIVLATRARRSIFAAALANKGAKVLSHPIARDELRSLAGFAREARGFAEAPDVVRARAAQRRGDSLKLSSAP
jgi:hypothetical protein